MITLAGHSVKPAIPVSLWLSFFP